MTKFILGTKEHMTQVFDEDGRVFPATVIRALPNAIVSLKNVQRDGYSSVQLGAGEKSKKNVSKAVLGHTGDKAYRVIKEFRTEQTGDYKMGETIDVSVFEIGDKVAVSGVSKGKGFQGVVKRHGFSGGPRSHGQKHSEREPGSIGSTGPQRVFKGKKMGGRMGGERVTVKNLKVLQVVKEEGILLVSGAVPGRRGTVIEVRG